MKYSEKIINKIIELRENGEYADKNICKIVNISHDTFITWKKEKSEFSELLKKADLARMDSFKNMARSGLAKLIVGGEHEEETKEYYSDQKGEEKLKSRKVVKKYILPNPTAVIFALTNRDSENFKHMRENKTDINFESLSDAQLNELFNKVMECIKGNSHEQ